MPFGTATVLTDIGKALFADRARTSPGTYTTCPKWIAIGVGATGAGRTAAATDTALSSEQETRAAGTESTVTTTVAGDTYQTVGTINITGARAIDEAGLFDQLASGGNMAVSATFPVINLSSGSSIQITGQVKIS